MSRELVSSACRWSPRPSGQAAGWPCASSQPWQWPVAAPACCDSQSAARCQGWGGGQACRGVVVVSWNTPAEVAANLGVCRVGRAGCDPVIVRLRLQRPRLLPARWCARMFALPPDALVALPFQFHPAVLSDGARPPPVFLCGPPTPTRSWGAGRATGRRPGRRCEVWDM